MVTALSGCVIMGVQNNMVTYYKKCNYCQTSEYEIKPYQQTEWIDEGIVSLEEYYCPKCEKRSKVKLKFYKQA